MISSQLIDLLQLFITPCNSWLHSPNVTLFDSGLPTLPCGIIMQFDSHIGYSVCTIRCNIGCGLGSLLSMVTSHPLAVPNTESTNCYNLWLVCLWHLQPLARHSLCFLILASYPPLVFAPRLRFSGFATSCLNQLWFFPAPTFRLMLRAAFLGLEVIASVFLGASLMI